MTSSTPPPPEPDDTGAADTGATDTGATDTGATDTGPADNEAAPPPPYPTYTSYSQAAEDMPAYPAGEASEPAPAPVVEQPTSIVRAVLLMKVGAGLSLLSIVVGMLTLSSVKDNIKQRMIDNNTYTQADLNTAYHVAIVSAIVGGVIAIALWLWMAYVNGKGHKWARTVASVFGGLSILGFITAVVQNQETAFGIILSGLTALLAVVILVLLWRRESTAFYLARSRRQRV